MDKTLTSIYDEVSKCSRCGFCQPTCPVYRVTGFEGSVARGHNLLIRDVLEGKTPLGAGMERNISQCLLCRACTFNCFPAVKTADNVVAARHAYLKEHGQPSLQHFIFHTLLPDQRELTRYLRFFSFGRRAGLASLARGLSIFPWFGQGAGRGFIQAQELMPKLPGYFLRDRLAGRNFDVTHANPQDRPSYPLKEGSYPEDRPSYPLKEGSYPEDRPSYPLKEGSKEGIIYFVGCGINFALPEVGEATLNLLVLNGFQVQVLEHNCCGLPPYVYGDLDAARILARQNILAFERERDKLIVTDCASCSSFLKDYPVLFTGDDDWEGRAKNFASRIRDINELRGLSPNRKMGTVTDPVSNSSGVTVPNFPGTAVEPKIVTYHDPCHLSRAQKLTQEPRNLLKSLAGMKFVELPEADWCCGGAGTYNLTHPEISLKILDRKMENLKKTKADYLVTSCPACIIQLAYGVRRWKLPVKVLHISQFSGK